MDFIKTVLEHADVLSAGIAGLLIFAILVFIGAYKIIVKTLDRQAMSNGTAELAKQALSTLATTTVQFTAASDRTGEALERLGVEMAASRRECAEKHLATHALLGELLRGDKNA